MVQGGHLLCLGEGRGRGIASGQTGSETDRHMYIQTYTEQNKGNGIDTSIVNTLLEPQTDEALS